MGTTFRGIIGLLFFTLFYASISTAGEFLKLDQIEKLVEEKSIKSVESLLAELPKGNFENYVLVYDSRSRQHASHEFPRVILRSPDINLLLAFNGGYDKNGKPLRGGNEIEAIEYLPQEQKFGFHIFTFDPKGDVPGKLARNVQSCSLCHANDPRPNFLSYYHWTGMYGSMDDFLGDDRKYSESGFRRGNHPDSYFDPKQEEIIKAEHEGLETHFPMWKSHPRYSHLADILDYEDGKTYSRERFTKRPNIQMQAHIFRMNTERITRLVLEKPNYLPYRFVMAGTLACSEDWPTYAGDYFPSDYKISNPLVIETQKVGKFDPETGSWDPFFWLFEIRDYSTRAWDTVYRNHYPITRDPLFNGASPGPTIRDVTHRYILWQLAQQDLELKTLIESTPLEAFNLFTFWVYPHFPEKLCLELREKSRKAIAEHWKNNVSERASFERTLFREEKDLYLYVGEP